MPSPRRQLHIHHNDDYYSVIVDGPIIIRITLFLSGSNIGRNVDFDRLSEDVKEKILTKLERT